MGAENRGLCQIRIASARCCWRIGGLKLVRMTREMSVHIRRARSSDLPAMAVGIYGGQRSHEILTKICPGAALQ